MTYVISEVSQYDFETEHLSDTPKHAIPPNNENEWKDIAELDSIVNPLNIFNISEVNYNRKIGSVDSGQAIKKP